MDKQSGGLDALTVDYLQLFGRIDGASPTGGNNNVTPIIAGWARWFQQLSKRFANYRGLFVNLLAQSADEAFKRRLSSLVCFKASCKFCFNSLRAMCSPFFWAIS